MYLAPEDMLESERLRFELMYFKHTLDKLGVTVEVEHAGKYKDYGDMFTRTDMSPETREVLTSVIDRLYGDLVKTMPGAAARNPSLRFRTPSTTVRCFRSRSPAAAWWTGSSMKTRCSAS